MKYIAKIEGQVTTDTHPRPFDCPRCGRTENLTFTTDTDAPAGPVVDVDCPCGHTWVDPRVPVGLVIHAVSISERIV